MCEVSPDRFPILAKVLWTGVSANVRRGRGIVLAGVLLASGLACSSDEQGGSRACEAGCSSAQDQAVATSDQGVAGQADAAPDQGIAMGPDLNPDKGGTVLRDATSQGDGAALPDASFDKGADGPPDAPYDRATDRPADGASDRAFDQAMALDGTSDQGNASPLDTTSDQGTIVPTETTCPDPALTGKVYYVCDCGNGADSDCKPGDDKSDGTSPATAWRTYGKAQQTFGSLPAGGTIAFCRGGFFSTEAGSSRFVNASCRADNRCVLRDYVAPWGSGDEKRPVIYAASGNAISFEDGGDPDPDGGYIVLNLEIAGSGASDSFGIFFYNDVKDVLLCNLHVHGFGVGVHVAGSNAIVNPASDGLQKRIVLRNSEITDNVGQGWLGGGEDCAIEYNRFDNNGFGTATFDHNIYVSGSVRMRVIGNLLTRAASIDGHCSGVSFVVHGQNDGLRIEGNTISEVAGTASPGCWGIAVDPGYSEPESFKNIVIARNIVKGVGNISIGVAACQDCLIENNVIIQNTSGNAIAAPDRDRGSDDAASTDVTIRNNSIYYASGVSGTAIVLGTEGTHHKLVSNAIMFDGEAKGGEIRACFGADLASTAYDAFDYNLCQVSSAGKWEENTGALSAWQAASGFDKSSVTASPGFASITEPYDLSAADATSPLVDHGDPANSATDSILGTPRDSHPDIGAYERK
jgi:hypothetical protein